MTDKTFQFLNVPRQPPRTRAQFHWVEAARFVDEDLRLAHFLHSVRELRPVFVGQAAGAHAVLVETAHRAEHTHDELRARHFH